VTLTIGSLFSGIGGLELGLEWAGLGPVLWQVEQDAFCNGILARHWPNAARFHDVRTVGATDLPMVDVICGGFPCQDVSSAGKRAGLAGERSGLWREFARITGELRPRAVVVENVRSGVTRYLCAVRTDLHQLGYRTRAVEVSAAEVGAPQLRRRVFVLAYADGLRESQSCGIEPVERRRTGNGCGDVAAAETQCGASQPSLGGDATGLPDRLDQWPAGRGESQHEWEPPRTLAGVSNRTAKLKALGNAVVPQCAEVAGRVLLDWMRGGP
jgi:DNA (cytosine-5)-methyltransferase 1